MTQTLLFLLVIGIGTFYAFKNGNKAKKDIIEFENLKYQKNNVDNEIVDLKFFGKIDLNNTKEYIDVSANINGNKISIDLIFFEKKVSKKTIEPTIHLLNNLSEIEKNAKKIILEDYKIQNVVLDYIEHHLQEFSESDLQSLDIIQTEKLEEKKLKFLNKIKLVRIGIYPEDSDSMATFDYTIGRDLTQYLIVIRFDSEGKLVEIVMES
ncbi:DUF2004 domain-containing protein [Flavobacterium sasangense]|uniref:DUF2004 domain-containing protein n=1 Tax=Flavobacterium sasangense TaxID=503361 RepID=UPI00047C7F11|nr:DUF2004 domain-containing protein [Flavobacterium sasangense]